MKRINISSRSKRTLSIVGVSLICVGAVAIVAAHYNVNAQAEPAPASSADTSTSSVSIPEIVVASELSSSSSAFVPSSGVSGTSSLTEISKPSSAPPKPVITGNSSALTNKSSKPSYSSKPKTAASSKKSTATKTSSSKPSGGKPGQIYVPGFGWAYPSGGSGTVVSGFDDGSGKQVGIMDSVDGE